MCSKLTRRSLLVALASLTIAGMASTASATHPGWLPLGADGESVHHQAWQ